MHTVFLSPSGKLPERNLKVSTTTALHSLLVIIHVILCNPKLQREALNKLQINAQICTCRSNRLYLKYAFST